MKKHLIQLITLTLLTALLTACGGGKGVMQDNNDSNQTQQQITLAKVKAIIASGGTITAADLNSLTGVSGAIEGIDYSTALAHGSYADPANPTTDEIQAIIDAANNHAPVATSQTLSIDEDTPTSFILAATDADGDTLSYTITTPPSHGTINGTTYTPKPNYHDTDSFKFKANDGTVDSAEATVNITVKSINDAPTITKTPPTTVQAGGSYSFVPDAHDVDGDTLTFGITNRPTWASFSETTGTLSGTPTNTHTGSTSGIVISVSDGKGGTAALSSFDLAVIFSSCTDTQGDQGYAKAAVIDADTKITKTSTTTQLRLWHLADGTRKACTVSGSVKVE